MRKLFRLTALLAAAMLVVWVAGCGDDDDDDDDTEPAATVTAVTPDGGEIAANGTIIVDFDNAVDSCTIGGKTATLSSANKKAEAGDLGLTEGTSATVAIEWTNKDGTTGSDSRTYTVTVADTDAPVLQSSSPADGDTNVSPDAVSADGIEIVFDENIDSQSLTLMIEGTPLNWKFSKDAATVTAVPLAGANLSFEKEYVIEGTVSDAAGNEADVSITFTTEAKE